MGTSVIDVRDLPEKEVETVQKFVEFLREQVMRGRKGIQGKEKEITAGHFLTPRLLGVKGRVSRKEIYDYL